MAEKKKNRSKEARPTVRLTASRILGDVDGGKGYASDLLETAFSRLSFDADERRNLTRLVCDVTRLRSTLDAVFLAFGGKPASTLVDGLRQALRVGVFELLFSRGVPDYAAVHEAVECAKVLAGPGAGKLCNAVLRNVGAGIRFGRGKRPDGGDRSLPLEEDAWVAFDRAVFPPAGREAEHLAAVRSHPLWLVRRWLGMFGGDGTKRILEENNRAPRVMVRAREGAQEKGRWRERLRSEGVSVERGGREDMFYIGGRANPAGLSPFRDGEITIQDETASEAVRALEPEPGQAVLDLCAAPGGKTVQAADCMGGRGTVIALDRDRRRLRLVGEAVRRTGAVGVFLVCGDGTRPPFRMGAFDGVLVDAPCSNTGVLRRRAEARWRLTPAAIRERARLAGNLLGGGASVLRRGGRLVYSTCSIEPEENQEPVAGFLARGQGFRVLSEGLVLPGETDGGYWAVLRREARP